MVWRPDFPYFWITLAKICLLIVDHHGAIGTKLADPGPGVKSPRATWTCSAVLSILTILATHAIAVRHILITHYQSSCLPELVWNSSQSESKN
jgi:hypothetical protein